CASTNDTVLVMASGAARPASPEPLGAALREASLDLARKVVAEAEGASKTLVVHVSGAADDEQARHAGRAVAGSLLVKTALFGEDPNAGRLLQAIGAAGVSLDPSAADVDLAGHRVVEGGVVAAFDQRACREALKEREVVVRVALGEGEGEATFFGCDLGYEYVRINAEYRT
ncbi:MAG TPA: bifunctional ornithine acetyltransferase/N-acetylglutamate synthase, partial [Actinomycetota bacterium]